MQISKDIRDWRVPKSHPDRVLDKGGIIKQGRNSSQNIDLTLMRLLMINTPEKELALRQKEQGHKGNYGESSCDLLVSMAGKISPMNRADRSRLSAHSMKEKAKENKNTENHMGGPHCLIFY